MNFKVNKTSFNDLLHLDKHTFFAKQKTVCCQIQYIKKKKETKTKKKKKPVSPVVEPKLIWSGK